jgi:hypothetical protein
MGFHREDRKWLTCEADAQGSPIHGHVGSTNYSTPRLLYPRLSTFPSAPYMQICCGPRTSFDGEVKYPVRIRYGSSKCQK